MDGDTRGGSALSVRGVSGKPIKFVGVGEGLDDLGNRISDRIYRFALELLRDAPVAK